MTTKTLAMEGITVIFKETLKEHEVIIVVKYSRNILQAGIVHPTIHIWKQLIEQPTSKIVLAIT